MAPWKQAKFLVSASFIRSLPDWEQQDMGQQNLATDKKGSSNISGEE